MLDFYPSEGHSYHRPPRSLALTQPDLEPRLRACRVPVRYLRVRHAIELTVLAACSPVLFLLCGLIALGVLIDSGRPVLFRQMRSGREGAVFCMVKFRTMRGGAGESDPLTREGDLRVTRIGRFLRRHRLDELPQLWNVMKGEMSVIGPRPESTDLSDLFTSNIPYYLYRRALPPGITGWAQVMHGYAPDLESMRGTVEHDLYYLMHVSFLLDLRIMLRTVRCIITGNGAR